MALKGHIPWNKGIKYTDELKARLNLSGLALGHQEGENHHLWKKDAGYSAIHYWVYRKKGKAKACEQCGFRGRCHWANISGEYRRDINDFKSLCPACHLKFDGYLMIPQKGCIKSPSMSARLLRT